MSRRKPCLACLEDDMSSPHSRCSLNEICHENRMTIDQNLLLQLCPERRFEAFCGAFLGFGNRGPPPPPHDTLEIWDASVIFSSLIARSQAWESIFLHYILRLSFSARSLCTLFLLVAKAHHHITEARYPPCPPLYPPHAVSLTWDSRVSMSSSPVRMEGSVCPRRSFS